MLFPFDCCFFFQLFDFVVICVFRFVSCVLVSFYLPFPIVVYISDGCFCFVVVFRWFVLVCYVFVEVVFAAAICFFFS